MSAILKKERLSLRIKLGYSAGQVGDALAYNFFFFFYFFFLTEVAGVSALQAGFINLFVVLWDAVTDPLIGYLSDNCQSRFGRRRPFILSGAFPLAILLMLSFSVVDFSAAGKFLYYMITAALFWTAYTLVDIPYYSLGAEITQSFDERTRLRIWGTLAMHLAIGVAGFAPHLVQLLGDGEAPAGWFRVSLAAGVIVLGFDLICWNATRGMEVPQGRARIKTKGSMKENLWRSLRLKPVKYVVAANFFFIFGMAVSLGCNMHVLTYIAPLNSLRITILYLVIAVSPLLFLPLISWTAVRFGKRWSFMFLVAFSAVAAILFYFYDHYSFSSLLVYTVLLSLATGAFWTLCYAMAYDQTELDEYIYGSRREGSFVALMSFSQKVGNALGILFLGLFLDLFRYNPSLQEQPELTVTGLKILYTIWPALFLFLSVICIAGYPLTKKKFRAIEAALEARKRGGPVDESLFLDLL